MVTSDQQVYNAAIKGGASPLLAKLIVAQARHESDNYSNYQTRENNNIFGFKYTKNSQYAQIGNTSPEGNAYAKYLSINDAVLDYVSRWMGLSAKNGGTRLSEFNNVSDTTTFATKLKGYGYYSTLPAETDQSAINRYIKGLNAALTRISIIEFIQKPINYAVIGGILIGITAYIYFLKNNGKFKSNNNRSVS